MKKFFCFCLSLLICGSAFAQLNIKSVTEKGLERIMVAHATYSWLYRLPDGNYAYMANTDNRFDHTFCTLLLGDSPESAIQTLNDLKTLMEEEIASVTVEQSLGDVTLTFRKQLGVRQLWIKQEGLAGRSWISLAIVEKFIKYFEGLLEKQSEE